MHIIQILKKIRHKILIKIYSLLPIKSNKIIFWCNSFKSYGCNPKYIIEYLLDNYPGKFDIVLVFDSTLKLPENIPDGIRIVKYFSKEYLYELHTAHFIICNARTGDSYYWSKRKKQIYIQTWHSSLRLKTIEKDAEKHLPQSYINAAKQDSERINYIISGCGFSSNIFKNSFWYDGDVIECGTPRIDYLLNFNNREQVLNKIGLSCEYKYILYAPTFRDDKDFKYSIDFEKITCACKEKFGGKWKVLYRLHPNLIHKITEYNLNDICVNMCHYPDMQELIVVSDLMITDYSSCMFDMMYLKRPCILYLPDYEKYLKSERDLYFDINKLPFYNAYNESELLEYINRFINSDYLHRIEDFMCEIDSFENGIACKTITELILEKR